METWLECETERQAPSWAAPSHPFSGIPTFLSFKLSLKQPLPDCFS